MVIKNKFTENTMKIKEKSEKLSQEIDSNESLIYIMTRKRLLIIIKIFVSFIVMSFVIDIFDLSQYLPWNVSDKWFDYLVFCSIILGVIISNATLIIKLFLDYIILKKDAINKIEVTKEGKHIVKNNVGDNNLDPEITDDEFMQFEEKEYDLEEEDEVLDELEKEIQEDEVLE